MEDGLAIKTNALEVLEKQLRARAKKNQYGIVAVGTGTDAYLHLEATHLLTKGMLELLLQYRFPVFISTKSTLILRDINLLKAIHQNAILPADLASRLPGGLILSVSVSTMDENISHRLEPGAATPAQRMQVLNQLKQEGFFAGVNAIPLLPFISDTPEEIEKIIVATKQQQADYVLAGGLTLFGDKAADSKTLFYKFLSGYNPQLVEKYDRLYGSNFYPPRYYQEKIKQIATALCKQHQVKATILPY